MNIKATIIDDLVKEILKLKYPNKFVVVVRGMEYDYYDDNDDNDEMMDYLEDVYTKLGIYQEHIFPSPMRERVFIECENEEEANEVFNMFPEDKAPYTIIWGPVDNMLKDINPEVIKRHADFFSEDDRKYGIIRSNSYYE